MTKKIANWREILPKMVNFWFEYRGTVQQVREIKIMEGSQRVEIKTSIKDHIFYFDAMPNVLQNWVGIATNETLLLNPMDFAKFEGEEETSVFKTSENKLELESKDKSPLYASLRAEMTRRYQTNTHINDTMAGKMLDLITKLGTGQIGNQGIRDIKVLEEASKAIINAQAQTHRDLKMLKDTIMPNGVVLDDFGNPINNENKPDENGNSNQKD